MAFAMPSSGSIQSPSSPAPPSGHYHHAQSPPPPPSRPLPLHRPSPSIQIPGSWSGDVPGHGQMGMPQLSPGGGVFHGHPIMSTSPQRAPSSSSSYHPPPGPAESSYHLYHSPVEAVPAPTPKLAYEAPVFRTFQDRKRAKDMALMAQATAAPQQRRPSIPIYTSPMGPPPARTPSQPPQPTSRHPQPSQSPSQPSFDPLRSASPAPSPARPLPSPSPSPSSPYTPPVQTPSPFSSIPTVLERSDTVSSIKSLDRMGFSPGKRPLPKPPVGVNSSKSLDRGIPVGVDVKKAGKKQPSVVDEEDDLVNQMAGMRSGSPAHVANVIGPHSILTPQPIVAESPSISTPPVIGIPTPLFTFQAPDPPSPPTHDKAPARFTPLPAINIPTSESEDDDSASGIAFTGLPVIAVSTEDTAPILPSRIQPAGAILCATCGHPIIGRIVNAMKHRFHPQCFRCNECGELLEHVSSYEWEGKAYCHLDYHDKFAHRCHHCKTPIVDPRFVTLDDPLLGQRYYHELHFFCSECGDPFLDPSRSSAPGAQGDDDDETNAFVIQKGHPYCERCHFRLHKPKCKACAKPIPDIAVNAMGAKWHKDCFVCQGCGEDFANNLFFPMTGKAYCTSCYEQMH